MKQRVLSLCMAAALGGCATKTVYITKTEYIPIVSDKALFAMDPLPAPPAKEAFLPTKPLNKDEAITLLRKQRDLLAEYSENVLKDSVMCRVRLQKVQDSQQKAAKVVTDRNQGQ